MKYSIKTAIIALILSLPVAANADTVWNMPTNYADQQFQTQNIRWFVEEVEKRTEGRLKINIHSNASLYKMAEIMSAVRTGQVAVGEVLLSSYANDEPLFAVDTLPFLAVGRDQAWTLYEVQKPYLDAALEQQGMKLLYSVLWPGQGIYSQNLIDGLDDLDGVKFRAYSPITSELASLVGAQPVVIPLPEVSQAFLTGAVDAMIVSSATIDTKPWEYSKYYYTTDAMLPRNAVFVNAREFARLQEDVQVIVMEVAQEAEARGWSLMSASDEENKSIMRENGMLVVAPSEELMESFRAVGETVLANWLEKAGPEGRSLIEAYRAAIK